MSMALQSKGWMIKRSEASFLAFSSAVSFDPMIGPKNILENDIIVACDKDFSICANFIEILVRHRFHCDSYSELVCLK